MATTATEKKYKTGYYTIYGLVDPFSFLIKYIGTTSYRMEHRFSSHFSKSNPKEGIGKWLNYLDAFNKKPMLWEIYRVYGSQEEAFKEEIFFIDTFKKIGHPLFNQTKGGAGSTMPRSDIHKKKIGAATRKSFLDNPNRGKEHGEKLKNKFNNDPEYRKRALLSMNRAMRTTMRPVLQYDINGNFICEYESAAAASKETKSSRSGISGCGVGKRKTCNGFIWKYKEKQ